MKKRCIGLALLLALSMAGCRRAEAEPVSAEVSQSVPAFTEKAGTDIPAPFTIEELLESNRSARRVLAERGGVCVRQYGAYVYTGNAHETENYFFLDGQPVYTRQSVESDGTVRESCIVGDRLYHRQDDRLLLWFDWEQPQADAWVQSQADDTLWKLVSPVHTVETVRDEGDTYLIEDGDERILVRLRVDKATLLVTERRIVWNGSAEGMVTVSYGDDTTAETYGLLDSFREPFRTVTLVADPNADEWRYVDSEQATYALTLPQNVEVRLVGVFDESAVPTYADEARTEPFVYPGNGTQDYTIYAF